MEQHCWMERQLILSHFNYHVFAMDSLGLFNGRGAWLKCLALFLPLNSGITCTNTLITVLKHISNSMCEQHALSEV